MLDNEFHISREGQASLVSIVTHKLQEHSTESESNRSLKELKELLKTLGIQYGNSYIQNRKAIDPATIIGSGKLLEIAEKAKEEGSTLLVFDFELTASQIRNIKSITKLSVVDRCHVILEIFAQHARTKEAKIQIEISRLQYLLPRLSGFWTHLSRQKGGVGVKGGEGEQQIELDRRIIRQRIEFYKKELRHIIKVRQQQKKKRQSMSSVTAALVGYTNAGKSSLMNRLCRVNILEEDKLFATLDSTYRILNPDTKPNMILIDTVGFISNLPNTLLEGFKTTLESAIEADLIIIVVDISDPHYQKHLEVTKNILNELGITNKEQMIVFNKKDQLQDVFKQKIILRSHPNSFLVSSFDKKDMKDLRSFILNHFLDKQNHYDLFVPYEEGNVHSTIMSKSNIIKSYPHEKGIFYRIKIPQFIFKTLGVEHFILSPTDPMRKEFSF